MRRLLLLEGREANCVAQIVRNDENRKVIFIIPQFRQTDVLVILGRVDWEHQAIAFVDERHG